VVHEEAARAGELVGLSRQHAQRQLLVRQVGAGQLERLGQVGLIAVERAALAVGPPRLQLLEAVFTKVLVDLAWGVVVGRHGNLRMPLSSYSVRIRRRPRRLRQQPVRV
jgi:hypothetical protein